MFQGQYQHGLDAKGRLILPVKIREELGDTFYLTKGLDGCLFIYPVDAWMKFAENINSFPTSDRNGRRLKRHFIGSSVECEPDKQGRFLIPQVLRDFAHIDKDVTVIGMCDRVELWSKDLYEEYEENEELPIEEISDQVVF